MKQGLFKRIFLLYGIIMLLSVAGTELFVTRTVREDHIGTLKDQLAVQASLIGRDLDFHSPAPLDQFCRKIKTIANARVTVVAVGGRVLGDSDHDSATMDNHAGRIELQQADLAGIGMTLRHSDTLDTDLLYVARKIEKDGGTKGFVRLSVPLREVDAAVNALRFKIVLAATLILIATGFFAVWQLDRVRRLTLQVRDFSAAVARGDLGKRLFLERAGEFAEIAGDLNAMTASLQANAAAGEEEKRRLEVILRTVPDALLIIDRDGVIRIANAASRISFGEAALPGKRLIEAIRDREFQALVEKARGENASAAAELSLALPEHRSFSVRVAPLSFREGERSGFVVMFHDITLLKRLEQVRQDFVANISHELKTPITAIQGFAETLLAGALEDREHARRFLETIDQNSRRINSLVDDLLTISKIELGAITIKKSSIRFREACDTVVALLGEKAKSKGLSIVVDAPNGDGTLQADNDRLVQVLTNLVDNAIKFTDKGNVTLGMAEENGRNYFFVEDTGIGIPDKHLHRIGERFYRVDAGRSRQMGGTGLGLAIVKHLVKAHGWEMKIESTVGKGTKMKIYV